MTQHGTLNGYKTHRCRCGPCTAANRDYMRDRRAGIARPHPTHGRHGEKMSGALSVLCWCEARVLWLSPAAIRAGLTESCGRPRCRPMSAPLPMIGGERIKPRKRKGAA